MKTIVLIGGCCLMAVTIGCDTPQLPNSGGGSSTASSSDADAGSSDSDIPDPGDVAPVPDEGREFTANDPLRGRRSRSVGGYAGAVFGARFWAEHQMIINQVKHALNLYWGEHGEYPQSHEEFMDKVIKFNQIQLPELMDNQEYFYDPEEGQDGLLVRPKQTDAAAEEAADAPMTRPET